MFAYGHIIRVHIDRPTVPDDVRGLRHGVQQFGDPPSGTAYRIVLDQLPYREEHHDRGGLRVLPYEDRTHGRHGHQEVLVEHILVEYPPYGGDQRLRTRYKEYGDEQQIRNILMYQTHEVRHEQGQESSGT